MIKADLNPNSPIIPGQSVGGLRLGIRAEELPELMRPTSKTTNDWNRDRRIVTYQRYECDDLVADCTEGIVTQVYARGAYRGKFDGFLGIGTPVIEIVRRFGPVVEDDEDALVLPGVPGLWYEVDHLIGEPDFIRAPVVAIGVNPALADLVERFSGEPNVPTSYATLYHHPLPPGFEFVNRWR